MPHDPRAAAGDCPLALELIATPAFQRLKQIRFLGAIDYRLVRHPNGRPGATRYSRYEHSIGVLRLAQLYCAENDLSPGDSRLVCAAALLHDIGHPPLSHSMETVFKQVFDIDHHAATEDIICGRVPWGKAVYSALRSNDLDVEEVAALISGNRGGFDGFFAGPITFDTIEGVLRSWAYLGSASSAPAPELVATAAIKRSNPSHRMTVDRFWKYKHEVYRQLIHSPTGILADHACCLFLQSNLSLLSRDSYFGTEQAFFAKLPGLRRLLASPTFEEDIHRMADGPISFTARQYDVHEQADFFARHDRQRYRQRRFRRVLREIRTADAVSPGSDTNSESSRELF